MDITIIRKDLSVAIRQNRAMWAVHARRSFLYILLLLFFGLALFLPRAISAPDTLSRPDWEVILGAIFLLVAAYTFFRYLRTKATFFTQLKEQCIKWEKNNQEISVRITDKAIYYQDNEIKTELKWTVYTSYIIRDNLIILIQQQPFVGDFAIDMSELSKEDLQALLSFLQPIPKYNTSFF